MRILQGIASAPLETLVTSTVSDMYFVHQRGTRLSIWGCMLASGVLLGQTISGAIIQNISFEATFGISALIFIPIVLLMYFVVVETTYNGPRGGSKIEIEEKGSFWTVDTDEKETYAQKLRLFRGRISGESFWKGAWKPVPLIAYPAVLFSTVVYGSYFTWLLTISVLSVTAFSMPPYNLNPAQIGLTNLPLLGVALIGSPISGWMADAAAKFMARRNGGIFEPEFRLTLMLVATPLATAGFLGFGMSVQNGAPLQWPILFMAIHSLSVPFASQASLTYVIDCHPKDANQAFVTINFTKAVFTFMATTYANGWFLKVGPRGVFDVITLINLGVCCLTIPAYIFGKRFRSMVSQAQSCRTGGRVLMMILPRLPAAASVKNFPARSSIRFSTTSQLQKKLDSFNGIRLSTIFQLDFAVLSAETGIQITIYGYTRSECFIARIPNVCLLLTWTD